MWMMEEKRRNKRPISVCYMVMGIVGTEIEKENRNRIKKKETFSNEDPTSTFVLSSHDRLSSSSAFFVLLLCTVVHGLVQKNGVKYVVNR